MNVLRLGADGNILFELVFRNLLEALFVERMDHNDGIFVRLMNDPAFQKVVTGWRSWGYAAPRAASRMARR